MISILRAVEGFLYSFIGGGNWLEITFVLCLDP